MAQAGYIIAGIQITQEGFKLYEQIKQRNTGQVVDPKGCESIVYTYVMEGKLEGPGHESGRCGVKKDHKRVFCCPNCFSHWK